MRSRSSRKLAAAAALSLLVSGAARVAVGDDDLLIAELGVLRGMLSIRAELADGFDDETRTSIERGLPITVRYTTELWRKRRLWFDKQIDSRVLRFRVRYDPGEELYSVTGPGPRIRETFASLDAALEQLSPRMLQVHPRWQMEDEHTYYVTVEMAIQPLTLEEFRELDGWISGRIRGDGDETEADAEPEKDGGVSTALFGFLLDLAGFGDKILEAETPGFRVSGLTELPRR